MSAPSEPADGRPREKTEGRMRADVCGDSQEAIEVVKDKCAKMTHELAAQMATIGPREGYFGGK